MKSRNRAPQAKYREAETTVCLSPGSLLFQILTFCHQAFPRVKTPEFIDQ
jgi:hypothetical protein